MAFWDFLKKRPREISSSAIPMGSGSIEGVGRSIPIPRPDPGSLNLDKGTEPNINLLYQFLDGNYEAKGYNDSLVYPDSSYLNQNLEALKNDLFRTIKKVKTFYEDFIIESDFHIESRSRSGLIETVEELKMKKRKAEDHLKKIQEIESNAQNNSGECLGITLSYTRGFQNGLAAISHHSILNRKL